MFKKKFCRTALSTLLAALLWHSPAMAELVYESMNNKGAVGPTYQWFDISETGTPVSLRDDDSVEVELPFDFPFYGENKKRVRISSNGYLTFWHQGRGFFYNTPLPSWLVADIIAPFWDDLNPGRGGTVHYYHDEDKQRFVVQYTNVPRFYRNGSMTFQVMLYQNGRILFQYKEMSGLKVSATIGVSGKTWGTRPLMLAYNASFVENGLAVSIFQSDFSDY